MNLLLDIGNTRIKWALADGATIVRRGTVVHRGAEVAAWTQGLPAEPRPSRILASNVAGSAIGDATSAWAAERLQRPVEFARSVREAGGVRNAYSRPELLGVDRWLGMIGIRVRCRDAFLLVAAGTAFTIDLVDGDGAHQGGVIVPGRSMMIETLKQKTGNIALAASAADALSSGMFGLNTAGAIESGATHALAGLLDRAIDVAASRYARLRLFGYGGDAADVFQIVSGRTTGARFMGAIEPADDVVLLGLAALAAAGELP